ncbi:MAG: MBL fold metallo-hydrolase, partial [Candidatus Aenigmatarchaeota archaeon]
IYANPLTLDLTYMLLYDSLNVQKKKGEAPHFSVHDIRKMEHLDVPMNNKEPIEFKTTTAQLRHAGHVPGASSILLDNNGKRVVFTGDINFSDTSLMKGADTNYTDISAVICESTYHYKNHPPREELAKQLKEKAQETLLNGGTVMLPSFALGRTQEMLLIMQDLGFPVYLDGMGKEATKMILNHPESVYNYKKLKAAFGAARKVKTKSDRSKALKKPSIIITTAGMLNGGPINFYIKKLHKQENCSLIMTGFQVPGTVGHTLMHTGRYVNEGLDIKPKFSIDFMDFSAHCGRDDLLNYLKKVNPEKVFPVHGENTEDFAKELKQMGFNAHAPENGERVNI